MYVLRKQDSGFQERILCIHTALRTHEEDIYIYFYFQLFIIIQNSEPKLKLKLRTQIV